LTKVDPKCSKSQSELTEQIDQLTKKTLSKFFAVFRSGFHHKLTTFTLILGNAVAGHTTEFVNNQIEKNLPFV